MSVTTAAPLHILADDLTGAAEAAGVLSALGRPVTVQLDSAARETTRTDSPVRGTTPRDNPDVLSAHDRVLDLHIRNAGPERASERLLAALDRGPLPDFIKIDSLLRGPLRTLIPLAAERAPVLFAPSLPALRRTVRNGMPLLGDLLLAEADAAAWRAEGTSAPRDIADLVPSPARRIRIPLDTIRDDTLLEAAFAQAGIGSVLLADAETPEDLAALAKAAHRLGRPVIPLGSSALLRAYADIRIAPPARPSAQESTEDAERVLIVIGSLEPITRRQQEHLPYTVVDAVAADAAARVTAALDAANGAVISTAAHHGAADPAVAQRIGGLVRAVVADDPTTALILVGGESARAVLTALGEDRLHIDAVADDGSTLSRTGSGRRIATRPGSFGDDHSLAHLARTLLGPTAAHDARKKDCSEHSRIG